MDAETHVGYRPLGRGLLGGVLLTILIHGMIVMLVYQSQRRSAARPEAVRDVIVTQTVTFTKKREKFWLPRIVTPPTPKAPEPVIKLAENPEAPPVPPPPKEAPQPQDREISRDLRRALERARRLADSVKEEPAEGPIESTQQGTSSQAVVGDAYWSEVRNAIKQNWSAPAGLINDAQLATLSAEVRVQIDGDGTLQGAALNRSSGNDTFDESCMSAVRATGRVPAPPPAIKTRAGRGVSLAFSGRDLSQ